MRFVSNFKSFVNERFYVGNLPNSIILLSSKLSNTSGNFLLYNIEEKTPVGYISFGFYSTVKSFTVSGAYSERGYGAFLYECAMTYVFPNGLSMSRDSNTSEDALGVWRKFNERNDVRKERMYSDEITHKKDDWIDGGYLDDEPEYRQSIFDLEDTRFFYSFGKEKLNYLINNGKKYMEENGITEQDIEYMFYDLE